MQVLCYKAGANNVRTSVPGTGGLIIIYAKKFTNNGNIQSRGGNAPTATSWSGNGPCHTSGGSSGGGSINIFVVENKKKGSIYATGGYTEPGGNVWVYGGNGGNGCVSFDIDKNLFDYVIDRRNTNIYKDIIPQETFEYEVLFK